MDSLRWIVCKRGIYIAYIFISNRSLAWKLANHAANLVQLDEIIDATDVQLSKITVLEQNSFRNSHVKHPCLLYSTERHTTNQMLLHNQLVSVIFIGITVSKTYWDHGFYSLSGRTSCHKTSRSHEAARFRFKLSNHFKIWQALLQHRCRDACQISKRYDHYNIQSRGFETSRDLAAWCLTA